MAALALLMCTSSMLGAQPSETPLSAAQVEYELRLPARSLNRMLEPPRFVRELSDGRVLILMNRQLYMGYPRDGRVAPLPDTVGGMLNLSADTVILVRRNQWTFRIAEKVIGSLPSTNPIVAFLRDNTLDPAGVDYRGNVYVEAIDPVFRDSLAVYRFDRRSGSRALVARLGIPRMLRGGVCPNMERAGYFDDGWIAILRSGRYRVDWLAPTGVWTKGAPIQRSAVPSTAAERLNYLQWEGGDRRRIAPGLQESEIEWPAEMCAWHSSFPPMAMPDGRLLVYRVPSVSSSGTVYDIVNREGRVERRLRLPPNQAVVGFGEHSVYVITTNGAMQQLSRHRFPE